MARRKQSNWPTMQISCCSNPSCNETDPPEQVDPYIAPYGWIALRDAWVIGTNDLSFIQVCSVECLEPAVRHRLEQQSKEQEPA
jgi:hypothetical protein